MLLSLPSGVLFTVEGFQSGFEVFVLTFELRDYIVSHFPEAFKVLQLVLALFQNRDFFLELSFARGVLGLDVFAPSFPFLSLCLQLCLLF